MKRNVLFFIIFLFAQTLQSEQHFIFPEGFLKGVALSAYQNGGDLYGKSNWTHFVNKQNGKKTFISDYQPCGTATNFWGNAHNDIALIKELGCNSVRFSIEWAVIEPEPGCFNETMLSWYEDYCTALINAGIMPTITLHHFVHPHWFDEIGGFTKESNIQYFTRFSKTVFNRLHTKVRFWYTINEPTVYSFMGYILGMHSPGHHMNFKDAAQVLKNLLLAHVHVYHTLKKLPGGNESQIGIVHQVLKAQAYSDWSPIGRMIAWFLNKISAHEIIKKFLQTGHFEYRIGGLVHIDHHCPNAPHSYDFIGINYYSRVIASSTGPTCYPGEIMTDMEYAIHAPGIYDAIRDLSELKVPIYITENGIPDAQDCHRAHFIKEYLAEVHRAIADGFDVRGYFYWTLMDNYEWDRGFTQKFGLYEVDFDSLERTLRPGAIPFKDLFSVANFIKNQTNN